MQVNYSSKINLDDYDKDLIADYISKSLKDDKKSLDNQETYKQVSCKIKEVIKNIYVKVEKVIIQDFSKREFRCTMNMERSDFECITSIFLHHYPEFSVEINGREESKLTENPIFPHFSFQYHQCFEVVFNWVSDNPLLLQHSSKFSKPIPSDYQEVAARKKLERNWKNATEGKTTDMEIVCGGKTFHAHKYLLLEVPYFEAMLEDDKKDKIDLTDISSETFEQVLKFAYFDSLSELNSESHFDLLLDVFAAAHKYMYEPLREHVIELIGLHLPPKENLEHKCKALLQKGFSCENKDLIQFALKLMTHFESKVFYEFIGKNFTLKEIDELIEFAKPLSHGKIVSRLEKIATILNAQSTLNSL